MAHILCKVYANCVVCDSKILKEEKKLDFRIKNTRNKKKE
jgi:hypothetical protein